MHGWLSRIERPSTVVAGGVFYCRKSVGMMLAWGLGLGTKAASSHNPTGFNKKKASWGRGGGGRKLKFTDSKEQKTKYN